jgi:hypothetical protein
MNVCVIDELPLARRLFTQERWDDLITARLAHIATLYSKWSAI